MPWSGVGKGRKYKHAVFVEQFSKLISKSFYASQKLKISAKNVFENVPKNTMFLSSSDCGARKMPRKSRPSSKYDASSLPIL